MDHVVVVPAYNEAGFIGVLLDSLVSQSRQPDCIIVVSDSSTDQTEQIVLEYAQKYENVRLLRGGPGQGRAYREIEVFREGHSSVIAYQPKYISKIDADMFLPTNYFEILLQHMDSDKNIAVGSGLFDEIINGARVRYRLRDGHVPGALKTYREAVLREIGGLYVVPGWDILDLAAIRRKGYRSITIPDLVALHRRRHASAVGIIAGNIRMGDGAYRIGTHPLFMIGRAVYRMLEPPYVFGGAALWWGYVRAWLTQQERIQDDDLVRRLRRDQVYRLLHSNRSPTRLIEGDHREPGQT